jgi:succinoglycan biosynthesis protein ExoM
MSPPKVCVAICTHNRPRQLAALLDGLLAQSHPDFAVIIANNGTEAASEVLTPYRDHLRITYRHITQTGVVAVRNLALQIGLDQGCDFLAFIDDDEVPVPDWLAALLRKQAETGADLVFGPVLATYHGTPPAWVTKGGFFERWGDTPGSGNVLIKLATLPDADWFRDAYAQTGGEDIEFFDRLMENGATRATAPDAIAHEDTPPERTTVRYIWRRGLRDGVVIARRIGLSDRAGLAKFGAGATQMLAKLGYAANHLFWTPRQPWRAVKAAGDLGSALAFPLYALGYRFRFYGVAQSPHDTR